MFPSICSAGIVLSLSGNQAMLSNWDNWGKQDWELFYKNYKIPVFSTRREALDWANKTMWIEPIRRKLWQRIHELSDLGEYNSKRAVHEGETEKYKIAGDIMQYVSFLETAVAQMEQYKTRKIKGDMSQVGAVFYAGSCVVNQQGECNGN